MKKKILLGTFLGMLIFLLPACGEKKTKDDVVAIEETKPEVKKTVFEQIGYNKDPDKNRSFIYYTDAEESDVMIEFARKQAWTERQLTYVTFVNSKDREKVYENTLYKDFDRGIMLEGIINDEKIVVGTFRKTPNGNEFWTEKGGFSVGTGEEIQLETNK